MTSKILITCENSIASVTLNYPEKYNILDPEMIQALTATYQQFEKNDDINIILLQANGKHFCAGADLKHMLKMSTASFEENVRDAESLAALFNAIYNNKKITVCYTHGKSMGGGMGLIAASDITLCNKDAQFSFSEVKLGLIPATISPFVLTRMGAQKTKLHMLSADFFDAKTAQQHHLIDYCLDELATPSSAKQPRDLIMHFLQTLNPNSAIGMQATKAWLNTFNPITPSTLSLAAKTLATVRTSDDVKNRITALFNR